MNSIRLLDSDPIKTTIIFEIYKKNIKFLKDHRKLDKAPTTESDPTTPQSPDFTAYIRSTNKTYHFVLYFHFLEH